MAAAFGWIAFRLYRDLRVDRAAHEKERKEWETRYVEKAESWIGKHHDLIRSVNEVLDRIAKRFEKR